MTDVIYIAQSGYLPAAKKTYHLYRDCPSLRWTHANETDAAGLQHWQKPCLTCLKRKEAETHG